MNKIEEFENKVLAMLKFMELISKRELAEFMVNQQKAIDGLTQNNESFSRAFRKMKYAILIALFVIFFSLFLFLPN